MEYDRHMPDIQLTRHHEHILQIHLNRPATLNALSQEVLENLQEILATTKTDHTIKALLLTGEGKGFCAGADIKQLAALDGQKGLAFARFGQSVFRNLELLGKPSLAAIHGFALGGGCELAMAASIRIAAENTFFGQPEIKLGVIPGFGGTQRLSRLIGRGRALEACLTGRRITTAEAHQWGLISEIVPTSTLIERALIKLQELITYSPAALASIMATIYQGSDLALEEASELEATHFGLCCTTVEKETGIRHFLEKKR